VEPIEASLRVALQVAGSISILSCRSHASMATPRGSCLPLATHTNRPNVQPATDAIDAKRTRSPHPPCPSMAGATPPLYIPPHSPSSHLTATSSSQPEPTATQASSLQ
jgi:hypothetical protein